MFYSGLEIISTFIIHHPVYGCTFHVRFNLLNMALAGPVLYYFQLTNAIQRKKKQADIFFKIFKNRQPLYIGDDY